MPDGAGSPTTSPSSTEAEWLSYGRTYRTDRETAKLEVGERRYQAHRKGWTSKKFVLEKEDSDVIIIAEKPSARKDQLVFKHGGNRYKLKKGSA